MTFGLVILDLKSGAMSTLGERTDAFVSENITSVLPDAEGRVWIGTYGQGLSVWTPATGAIRAVQQGHGAARR